MSGHLSTHLSFKVIYNVFTIQELLRKDTSYDRKLFFTLKHFIHFLGNGVSRKKMLFRFTDLYHQLKIQIMVNT